MGRATNPDHAFTYQEPTQLLYVVTDNSENTQTLTSALLKHTTLETLELRLVLVESMTWDCHINQCRPSPAQAGNAMGVVGGTTVTAFHLARWILWYSVEHNKEIVTSDSFSMQHPNPNKHITSTAGGGGGQQHSCQPLSFSYPAAAPAKSTVLQGIPGMN
ncbi:hypothetical protein FQN60_010120, partial [Etheostoma spectabile]